MWEYCTAVQCGIKNKKQQLYFLCQCVTKPSPYFAAALVSQHRPFCFLCRASPASQSGRSHRHCRSSSSPTTAPYPLWLPPPASWTRSLHPAALSSFDGLRLAAWDAPSPADADPSLAPDHGQRPAPGTPCARAHQFCRDWYTIPFNALYFNHFVFSTRITGVTNFRPRSSLLSMCCRLRWSPLPMDLSSLFGLSGFFALSLGFSESTSSHLSGFLRSYIWNNETWNKREEV